MHIRLFLVAAIAVVVNTGTASAQSADAQREAMKKLDFLVGHWSGEGWMEFVPGQRAVFKGTEVVQSKVDGLVVTIDGLHRGQRGGKGPEVVVHNAFGVISFDAQTKRYRFQGFTSRGNHEDTEATVTEGQLVWGMKIPQFGDVRYTIKLDDKGRWFEIGEVTRGGNEWRKFFEMTLSRAEPK